jgi:5-methylcytosine-specific restriction protein A
MSEWRDAVRAELHRFRYRTGRDELTRAELLDQSLANLEERFRGARTPEQTVSRVLQELRDRDEIAFLGGGEYRLLDVDSPFEMGEHYRRRHLHDWYGGNRQSGIAPAADYPFVFLFTSPTGSQYGYVDEFREDGTFVYTGEGQVGDMEFTRGNRAIRDHATDRSALHLFETAPDGEVVYVGEYEYADHFRQELEDANDVRREALRFELRPAGDGDVTVENPDSVEELYRAASGAGTGGGETSTAGCGTVYTRSEAVKAYARAVADGHCIGCDSPAPFEDGAGDPFLEVHHLTRRSDGGVDRPENVVAICPNCHRRVHYGTDGDEFNAELRERIEDRDPKLEL